MKLYLPLSLLRDTSSERVIQSRVQVQLILKLCSLLILLVRLKTNILLAIQTNMLIEVPVNSYIPCFRYYSYLYCECKSPLFLPLYLFEPDTQISAPLKNRPHKMDRAHCMGTGRHIRNLFLGKYISIIFGYNESQSLLKFFLNPLLGSLIDDSV